MKRTKSLSLLVILGFFVVGAAFTVKAQKLSNKFKTWEISEGRSGGIRGMTERYSLDSNGNLIKRQGSTETTQKIGETALLEIVKLLGELKLPGTRTGIVKGDGIYDGIYGGFTIRLDGKVYKVEGKSFYKETQVVLTASQKKTLDELKSKLTEIRRTASVAETKPALPTEISVQQTPPPIMTGKSWTIEIYRRNCVYDGGDLPNCYGETIFWRGKLTRRGKSFDFDAVWRNEKTGEEVRDKVTLIDAVRERVVFRRDGEEKEYLGKLLRGGYRKESPNFIRGNEGNWRATIESETADLSSESKDNPTNSQISQSNVPAPTEANPLANTNWFVESYGTRDSRQQIFSKGNTDQGDPASGFGTLIEFSGSKFGGRIAGCNILNYDYTVKNSTITTKSVSTTVMACSVEIMKQEREIHAALETAHSFRLDSEQLEIFYNTDKVIFLRQVKPIAPLDPAKQKMVFRYEYWNYAREFQHKGWYVDEQGGVYKYIYERVLVPQKPSEIKFKFKVSPTLIAQITPEVLTEKRKLLKKIEKGKYRELQGANDAGTQTISAFIVDTKTGKLRELILVKKGDFVGINNAPETQKLIEWLFGAVPKF